MKIWHVLYVGVMHYKAHAIVRTSNSEEHGAAELLVKAAVRRLHPTHDPEPVRATLLDTTFDTVFLLGE